MQLRQAPPLDAVKKTGIARKQVEADHPGIPYENATIGVFHDAGNEMPSWYVRALDEANDRNKTGYNWSGNQAYLKQTTDLVLGKRFDNDKVHIAPTYGGSDAISLGNNLLGGPIVPIGVPTWPNHPGLIQETGAVVSPYPFLNNDGTVNIDKIIASLDPREQKRDLTSKGVGYDVMGKRLGLSDTTGLSGAYNGWMMEKQVSPLIQAVCQNPTGVDIPQEHWSTIADAIITHGLTIQVDLAYIGLGEGMEEDTRMIRYFAERGVKMMIYFSNSKFHGHYGNHRVGALLVVNHEDPKLASTLAQLAQRVRTSAVAEQGQKVSAVIEGNDAIREDQREWLEGLRQTAITNRGIISEKMPQDTVFEGAKGPFIFAPDPVVEGTRKELLPFLFPELAHRLEIEVPDKARSFPASLTRVAGVPTSAQEGAGLSGVRIALPSISEAAAKRVAETLEYAYEQAQAS